MLPSPLLHVAPRGQQVRNYFNTTGFDRWRKIYGETDDVNKVQLDIREGHAQTVEKVLKWLDEEGGVEGITMADAGCGTGEMHAGIAQSTKIYSMPCSTPQKAESVRDG